MQQKLSLKTAVLSVAVLLILMTPATVIHELGHSAVCVANGYKTDIRIDPMSATSYCYSDEIKGNFLFYVLGGGTASVIMLAPLLSQKVRTVPWRFIPLLTLSISHGVNAVLETTMYDYYISSDSILPQLLMIGSILLFIGLIIKYGRVSVE